MPKHIPPFCWSSLSGSKDEVILLAIFRLLPDPSECRPHDPLRIKRNLTIPVKRFGIVKIVIIQPLVDHIAILEDVVSAKRKCFANTHRSEDNQGDDRPRRLLKMIDYGLDLRKSEQHGRLRWLLRRKLHTDCCIPGDQVPSLRLGQCCSQCRMHVADCVSGSLPRRELKYA